MERQAAARLFDQFGDDVFRLALSYLGNSYDAEDVCQGVFLKLIEHDVTILDGKEKAFLLTCTANDCKNLLRSFWRKNVGEFDDSLVFESDGDKEVWDAVMHLPTKYRLVVHLYYYEGYSQNEIADILKISVSAVQTRMSRAKKLLSKELD